MNNQNKNDEPVMYERLTGNSADSTTFDDEVKQLAMEIAELVIKKQKDYGPKNILNSPYGAEVGLVVRMFDKLARISNLGQKGNTPENEPLKDSWMDMAGYSLIGLMVQRGTFTLPLKETDGKSQSR